LKLPSDFGNEISKALNWKLEQIAEWFTLEEDKEGYFWARLKPKKFLETPEFKTMCALARDLGGEEYVQGALAWAVPGPCAKKAESTSTPEDARSKTEPSGVTPRSVTDGKSRPPQFMVPLKALLSMPFQCRTNPDDPEMAELTESIKALGVLQPILVRPKPNGLYEIVYGQRRARAAEKAGLVEVPVTIRFLSDEEAFTLQLTENLQRKDLSEEEKTRALGELAKRTGWNAQQIADKLKMSYTWVTKYLPAEFKDEEKARAGALGGESKSATLQHSATQRVAGPPAINCARCRNPIQGPPVHLEDSYYCQECAEQLEAEAVPTLLPGQPKELGEPTHLEPAPPEPPAVDIGGFECPECHKHFIVEHLPNGKHKLKPVREAED
jgi:ParB/RepB/Spo0J family partition protein